MGLDFKDSFGPGQNLAYLFRPLTPFNISKGVYVTGEWKIFFYDGQCPMDMMDG